MKAAILNGYHKNECDLEIKDIPVPEIGEQEVLVKIHTAGVNPLDNMIIHGEVKMIVPYKFPLVMGNEFVGVIEKTGAKVSKYSVGDRVYGRMPLQKIGAFAEYAAIDQNAIAKVPEENTTRWPQRRIRATTLSLYMKMAQDWSRYLTYSQSGISKHRLMKCSLLMR